MYLNSRYARAHLPTPPLPDFKVEDTPTPGPDIVVRDISHTRSGTAYVWQDGDRLDRLAEYFGLPRTSWWMILDANPQIEVPTSIKPGDRIWLPIEASRAK